MSILKRITVMEKQGMFMGEPLIRCGLKTSIASLPTMRVMRRQLAALHNSRTQVTAT